MAKWVYEQQDKAMTFLLFCSYLVFVSLALAKGIEGLVYLVLRIKGQKFGSDE